MKRCLDFVLAGAVTALAFSLLGAGYVPELPMPPGAAMIYNAGSGDFAGFRIVIKPDGEAISVDGASRASGQVQPDIAQKFFSDLAAAGSLAKLPAQSCSSKGPDNSTTTVEVNSAITVSWHGENSPPLSCVADPQAEKILLDATTIQRALYVQVYRKRATLASNYGYGIGYQGSASGGSYGGARYASFDESDSYNYGSGSFHMDPFQSPSLDMGANFSTGRLDWQAFSAENGGTVNPYSGALQGSSPYTSIPNISPFTSLPAASVPTVYPWAGSPVSTGPGSPLPYSNAPFASAPNSGSP